MKNIDKRMIFLFAGLLLVAGAVIFLKEPRGFQGVSAQKEITMKGKTTLKVQNPVLDFTFEYPAGEWKPVESQGRLEKYDDVRLMGPADQERQFVPLIKVTVKPLAEAKTAEDLLDAHSKIFSNMKNFKILKKRKLVVGGEPAVSVLYEYETLLPRESLGAKPVVLSDEAVFTLKNNKSYRLFFHVLSVQRKDLLPVFERVLSSFRFKE